MCSLLKTYEVQRSQGVEWVWMSEKNAPNGIQAAIL